MRALVVKSQYSNINGGYVKKGTYEGYTAYAKDLRYGGSKTCIFRSGKFGKEPRWFFSGELPSGNRMSCFFSSLGDAPTPERAEWPEEHLECIESVSSTDGPPGADVIKHLFKDKAFPHSAASLGAGVTKQGEVEWVPCRLLRRGDVELFDGIDPKDLLQGQFGNCWLVAAMSCLAEFPDVVKSLFREVDMNTGRFVVRLFDHMQERLIDVTIDEFVPCHPRRWWDLEAKPLFARPNGNEMWCLLLEKAMAKLLGSYSNLVGGNPAMAFRALTGEVNNVMWKAEGKNHQTWGKSMLMRKDIGFTYLVGQKETVSAQDVFNAIHQYDKDNFLIAASIDAAHTFEHERADGLIEGHAYSILHVIHVRQFRLLCLRNPWGGDKTWKGAWCDNDSQWSKHPEVAQLIRPQFGDDGMFWMSWQDFLRIFCQIFVCCKSMRSGDAAEEHREASIKGSITAAEIARIRAPSNPSHPPKPYVRKMPASHLETLPEQAGESPTIDRKGIFAAGQLVEYFSQSQQKWVLAKIEKFHPDQKAYRLEGLPHLVVANHIRESRTSAQAGSPSFSRGQHVEYFSKSQQRWMPTKVIDFVAEYNAYKLEGRQDLMPSHCIREPLSQPQPPHAARQPAQHQPEGRPRRFTPGEHVEYFSAGQQKWLPARVIRPLENGAYQLDIQPFALPGRVREALQNLAGEWFYGDGKKKFELLIEGGEHIIFKQEAASAEGTLRLIGGWWEGDVKVGIIRLQRDERGTIVSQFKKSSEEEWEERILGVREGVQAVGGVVDEPGNTEASNDAGMYKPGESVEYFSESMRRWIPAKVLRYNHDMNTYDLDVRRGAIAERVRRTGERFMPRHPQNMDPSSSVSFAIGESVEYFSTSMQRWLLSKVICFHQSDGSYDLDCRMRAPVVQIRKVGAQQEIPFFPPPRSEDLDKEKRYKNPFDSDDDENDWKEDVKQFEIHLSGNFPNMGQVVLK